MAVGDWGPHILGFIGRANDLAFPLRDMSKDLSVLSRGGTKI